MHIIFCNIHPAFQWLSIYVPHFGDYCFVSQQVKIQQRKQRLPVAFKLECVSQEHYHPRHTYNSTPDQ